MQVFLSSTYRDLEAHRAAVSEAIKADGHEVRRMEDFGARNVETWRLCSTWISECDALVLLLGTRYGSLMRGEEISYTHAEYEYASRRDIPILAFVSEAHAFAIRPTTIRNRSALEQADAESLADFSTQVTEEQQVHQPAFRTAEELVAYVRAALRSLPDTPPRARTRWRNRRRLPTAAAIRSEIAHRDFSVVLVDLVNARQERTPVSPRSRLATKLHGDVKPALHAAGVRASMFTDIDVEAPTDAERFARRAEYARSASVVVLVAEGQRALRDAEAFYGGRATVAEWRRSWIPEPRPADPRKQPQTRRRYDDADLHSCDLALAIHRYVERTLEARLGMSREDLERSVLVASASIAGAPLVPEDIARFLRLSLDDAASLLDEAARLGVLTREGDVFRPTRRGRRIGKAARRFGRTPSSSRRYRAVQSYVPRTWPPEVEESGA